MSKKRMTETTITYGERLLETMHTALSPDEKLELEAHDYLVEDLSYVCPVDGSVHTPEELSRLMLVGLQGRASGRESRRRAGYPVTPIVYPTRDQELASIFKVIDFTTSFLQKEMKRQPPPQRARTAKRG
jgi:hypothetical protein